MATDTTIFHREKHVSYWLRCLRSPLPHQYTATDSTRMTLAFFTVSALDLLGVLFERTSRDERGEYAQWIYTCQLASGGFRGFPGTDFLDRSCEDNQKWDPANVPATYFALSTLCILGDDLSRVKRRECLNWLRRMQRRDGSFGELLGPRGTIEGGTDTRFAYCAICIRYILQGSTSGEMGAASDINVDGLVHRIRELQTYDGGISESPMYESHAGFTYCAIAALSLLNRLPPAASSHQDDSTRLREAAQATAGLSSYGLTVQWLVSRLTLHIEDDLSDDDDDADMLSGPVRDGYDVTASKHASSTTQPASTLPERQQVPAADASGETVVPTTNMHHKHILQDPDPPWTGFNGRCNKMADTCYAFWVGASLTMLRARKMVVLAPTRRYLLEKTQHLVAGGFGKLPGDPPDVYHSYLGLAALSLLQDGDGATEPEESTETAIDAALRHDKTGGGQLALPESAAIRGDARKANVQLLALDPALCVTVRARRWIDGLSWTET